MKREPDEPVPAALRQAKSPETNDQPLWAAIRNRTAAISFNRYSDFMDRVLSQEEGELDPEQLDANKAARLRQHHEKENRTPDYAPGAYRLLKTATQMFLLLECGGAIQDLDRDTGSSQRERRPVASTEGRPVSLRTIERLLRNRLGAAQAPEIQTVLRNAFRGSKRSDRVLCSGYLVAPRTTPALMELIWSYWHEEAMLVETMHAIGLRFRNRRGPADRDPLAQMEIAPLYSINNLLWGYMQDEPQRLSVRRRAYEYDHHYGLTLSGGPNSKIPSPAARSRFLEAFHSLLYICAGFFRQDDDTTAAADGLPILDALQEVQRLLAEGAHNQFGDLPWTARAEMLIEQWILSRPPVRQFLQSRDMLPYREAWMGQVDTMKRLQGWTDVSVTHFSELAVEGERILLSVRHGSWSLTNHHAQAAAWARYWRPEIQNYMHSYRAVTGVDLQSGPEGT